ncbi:MAG: ATP-dependent RNA helicase DbpA [bacterium]
MNFNSLGLAPKILSNLKTLNYNAMTPIQAKSLPLILAGHDIIGQAKTGSGKTAAFGLGVLSNLIDNVPGIQSLILCPTRELADQVASELRKLARSTHNVKIITTCGGTSESLQAKSLSKGAHIVVGTPGRVLKFLKTKRMQLGYVNTFVLDEADKMLDMGFSEDITEISSHLPRKRQSLLFSATFPKEILKLSELILNNAKTVKVDLAIKKNLIKEIFYLVEDHDHKIKYLSKLLGKYQPESTVIFCKTKIICDDVAHYLIQKGISAIAIHGDHEQKRRTLALTKFSNGSCLVLVATDVAARGLDIKNLKAVINFDLTSDIKGYIHRIGRTGRQENAGLALSFYVEQETYKLDALEKHQDTELIRHKASHLKGTKPFKLKPKNTTLYISGGRKDKIRPGDIVGGIIGTSKIDAQYIGDINVLDTFSYVAVDTRYSDQVIKALKNGKIKKRKYRVGKA